MKGGMLLNAEDRIAYWGNKHMNVAVRDVDDDSETDMPGLERVLYSVEFLGVTDIVGVRPYEELADDLPAEEDAEEYEDVDSQTNPFDYEAADDEIQPAYPLLEEGEDPFAQLFSGEDDSGESPESPELEEEAGDANPKSPVIKLDELKKAS